MKYRLKALGWHFGASTFLLLLIVGTLYLGWYRWPGWYLADMLKVLPITVGVDAALGPLLTFIIASPSKPRRDLARDIAVIAVVQLVALVYGTMTLWHGRPLYYAYSGRELSVVQGIDLAPAEVARGQQENPNLAPHWYSLPRWIYAPSPPAAATAGTAGATAASAPAAAAATAGAALDGTTLPRYFQPWSNGLPDLRTKLQKVDDWRYFSVKQKGLLKQRLVQHGFTTDYAATMPLTGRGVPLLAVFDPNTLEIKTLLSAKP